VPEGGENASNQECFFRVASVMKDKEIKINENLWKMSAILSCIGNMKEVDKYVDAMACFPLVCEWIVARQGRNVLQHVKELQVDVAMMPGGEKYFFKILSSGALPSLQILVIRHNTLSMEWMQQFFSALSERALTESVILTNLVFIQNEISTDGLKGFSNAISSGTLKSLIYLNLNTNHITSEGMIVFLDAIKPNGEMPMGTLESLQSLSIGTIGDDGMMAFSAAISRGSLANIVDLRLGDNQIRYTGMDAFANAIKPTGESPGALDALTHLELGRNEIGDEGIKAFSLALSSGALASLQKLYLNNIQIGDAGMKDFSAALSSESRTKLALLDLGGNQIGMAGMIDFSAALFSGALANLTNLLLSANQIGDEGMIAFAEALKPTSSFPMGSLASLKVLYLGGNQIGDSGMIAFADAIKPTAEFPVGALGSLQELWLVANSIGDEGMKAFSSALSSGALGSLQELNLDINQISYIGMQAFSDAIAMGALVSLTLLGLGHNKIGDKGMKVFSGALHPVSQGCTATHTSYSQPWFGSLCTHCHHKKEEHQPRSGALASLQYLWLHHNQIGDEGMKAFSSALSSGALASLHILYLNNNQIGDAGMKAFSAALSSESRMKLTLLYLSGNQIGSAGMISFANAIEGRALTSLRSLSLDILNMEDGSFVSAVNKGGLPALEVIHDQTDVP
jgi:Leucine-rich repeat (LRR) protein